MAQLDKHLARCAGLAKYCFAGWSRTCFTIEPHTFGCCICVVSMFLIQLYYWNLARGTGGRWPTPGKMPATYYHQQSDKARIPRAWSMTFHNSREPRRLALCLWVFALPRAVRRKCGYGCVDYYQLQFVFVIVSAMANGRRNGRYGE